MNHGLTAEDTVRRFWQLMATNDFDSVAAVLAPALVVEWPQSNERIRGAERFIRMNREYPAHGPWRFELHRLVAGGSEVVTHVAVSDGVQSAEAISFFEVQAGRIVRMVEFWPESYEPPPQRAHLTEPLRPTAGPTSTQEQSTMIIVLANVQVVPHHLEEARRIAHEHVERSRLEPGCVSHAVYEDAKRPNHLAFVEEWASEEALLAHFAVPASRTFVDHLARLSASQTRIRLYRATELPFPRAAG